MHLENTTEHPIHLTLTSKGGNDANGRPAIITGRSVVIPRATVDEKGKKVNGVATENVDGLPVPVDFDDKDVEAAKHDKVVAFWFDNGDLVVGKAKASRAHHEDEKPAHKK